MHVPALIVDVALLLGQSTRTEVRRDAERELIERYAAGLAASGVPDYKLVFSGVPSPSNPLGMKGCGEAGAIGSPPAIINAICNALDVRHVEMPATPERIWRLCQEREAN